MEQDLESRLHVIVHLQRGGCENAEEVVAAFRRMVESGMKGAPIHPMDLLTVRSCGQRVVETYRKKALEVGLQGGLLSCILPVLPCWAGLNRPHGTVVAWKNH